MELLIILIILLIVFGGGFGWSRHSSYSGPAWGGNLLGLLVALVVIIIVLRLLGVA